MESDNRVFIGHRHEWGGDVPFGLDVPARRQHVYAIGQTGAGKSTLLHNLILQDIEIGRGVALIDPHGDLSGEILEQIPASRTNDVIYFDPSARDPLPINFFRAAEGNWHLVASGIVSAFKKIWGDSWGPRLEYVLYATLAALLQCENTTLLGVSRMLSDDKYRAWVVKQVKDPMIQSFWVNEFEKMDRRFRQEVIAPVQNKVGQLLLAPALRNIMGQIRTKKVNFRAMMDRKRIFIANLSKGKIGETHSILLGALLVTGFEMAALSRADVPIEKREDYFLYADEFQNYATDSFASLLSEARKYRLNLTLAHQFMEQLDEKVRAAVFGNVGTLLAFRVGQADADILERQFGGKFSSAHFTTMENFELCAKLLHEEPFLARSLPPLQTNLRRRETVVRHSRKRFNRKRRVVQKKIGRWLANRH